jgi:DNA-binding transcriptional MerR regulator
MLKIGAFSQLAHTSIKTLRFYDAQRLLRPAHVDADSGYRYYTADQLGDLQLILRLKHVGFSLTEIRDALTNRTDSGRLRTALLEKQYQLARQVSDTQDRIAGLDTWLEQLRVGQAAAPYAIVLKRLDPGAVASIRTTIRRYSDAIELLNELRHHLRHHDRREQPAAAIWHTCGDYSGGPIDCEVFAVTERPPRASGRLRVQQQPATLMACVVHQGDIGNTASPYAAVRAWAATHGYRVVGAKRELYWQGDLEQNRQTDVTEIQFPICADSHPDGGACQSGPDPQLATAPHEAGPAHRNVRRREVDADSRIQVARSRVRRYR